jgi:uncharacterized phage infection (PIP) family protein YhgE
MVKMFALLLITLLALASTVSYVVLTGKITVGRQKIADGQKQLKEGEEMLAKGKTRLANGKQQISLPNSILNGIKSIPLMGIVNKLPVSGEVMRVTESPVREGNSLIAAGNAKVIAGEKQLAAGQEELKQGMARLTQANIIRMACGASAIFFCFLLMILGYCWRHSLRKMKK